MRSGKRQITEGILGVDTKESDMKEKNKNRVSQMNKKTS